MSVFSVLKKCSAQEHKLKVNMTKKQKNMKNERAFLAKVFQVELVLTEFAAVVSCGDL
jgi:hypothetical protein